MKKVNLDFLFKHQTYFGALLCALLISILFSFKRTFPYSYQSGEKWQYQNLYAPFEFSIEKTPFEIDSIKNELDKHFIPHLTLDKSGYTFAKEILDKEFKRQMGFSARENPSSEVGRNAKSYYKVADKLLKEIYDRGILPAELTSTFLKSQKVIILKGDLEVKDSLSRLYTVVTALDLVRDSTVYLGIIEPEFVISLISDCMQANLTFDNELNAKIKYENLENALQDQDTIKTGELLVAKDAFISKSVGQRLDTFREQYWIKNRVTKGINLNFLIHCLITSILLLGFVYFAKTFERHKPVKNDVIWFIFGAFLLFSLLAYLQSSLSTEHSTVIPYAIVALYLRSFLSKNISLVTYIILILIASLILEERYEFLATEISIGIVVVFMSLDLEHKRSYINMMLTIFFVHFVFQYIFHWVNTQQFLSIKEVMNDSVLNTLFFLLFIPILPLFDHWIKIVSDFTLVKLLDEQLPLVQEIKQSAPGTFEHSKNVANMAYFAAKAINARPLLAKAGGLYHDIGKLDNPLYFLENGVSEQHHNSILPLQSAEIIKLHVENGVKRAIRYRLPAPIINIIRTHHGDSRIETFYKKHQLILGNDDDAGFYYAGPKPTTKEEVIVMLADSVDAAYRRYESNGSKNKMDLIQKVVDSKWKNGQLSHSAFTFKDIEICKEVFEKMI